MMIKRETNSDQKAYKDIILYVYWVCYGSRIEQCMNNFRLYFHLFYRNQIILIEFKIVWKEKCMFMTVRIVKVHCYIN